MPSDDLLRELNALVREQLNAFEEAQFRGFTQSETQQYITRKERIKTLVEQLEVQAG